MKKLQSENKSLGRKIMAKQIWKSWEYGVSCSSRYGKPYGTKMVRQILLQWHGRVLFAVILQWHISQLEKRDIHIQF